MTPNFLLVLFIVGFGAAAMLAPPFIGGICAALAFGGVVVGLIEIGF